MYLHENPRHTHRLVADGLISPIFYLLSRLSNPLLLTNDGCACPAERYRAMKKKGGNSGTWGGVEKEAAAARLEERLLFRPKTADKKRSSFSQESGKNRRVASDRRIEARNILSCFLLLRHDRSSHLSGYFGCLLAYDMIATPGFSLLRA